MKKILRKKFVFSYDPNHFMIGFFSKLNTTNGDLKCLLGLALTDTHDSKIFHTYLFGCDIIIGKRQW